MIWLFFPLMTLQILKCIHSLSALNVPDTEKPLPRINSFNLHFYPMRCVLLFGFHGFPGGLCGKASACNAGDLALIPGLGRSPGEGNSKPSPVPLPGKSHGWRSLVGYSPWGHKELDITEQIYFTYFLLVAGVSLSFSR